MGSRKQGGLLVTGYGLVPEALFLVTALQVNTTWHRLWVKVTVTKGKTRGIVNTLAWKISKQRLRDTPHSLFLVHECWVWGTCQSAEDAQKSKDTNVKLIVKDSKSCSLGQWEEHLQGWASIQRVGEIPRVEKNRLGYQPWKSLTLLKLPCLLRPKLDLSVILYSSGLLCHFCFHGFLYDLFFTHMVCLPAYRSVHMCSSLISGRDHWILRSQSCRWMWTTV